MKEQCETAQMIPHCRASATVLLLCEFRSIDARDHVREKPTCVISCGVFRESSAEHDQRWHVNGLPVTNFYRRATHFNGVEVRSLHDVEFVSVARCQDSLTFVSKIFFERLS